MQILLTTEFFFLQKFSSTYILYKINCVVTRNINDEGVVTRGGLNVEDPLLMKREKINKVEESVRNGQLGQSSRVVF